MLRSQEVKDVKYGLPVKQKMNRWRLVEEKTSATHLAEALITLFILSLLMRHVELFKIPPVHFLLNLNKRKALKSMKVQAVKKLDNI